MLKEPRGILITSLFFDRQSHKFLFRYELNEGKFISTDDLIGYYSKLLDDHPGLISIEDPLYEKDYEGWKKINEKLGGRIMIVGDDLFTTNTRLIKFAVINSRLFLIFRVDMIFIIIIIIII